jgi:hypothetical protein
MPSATTRGVPYALPADSQAAFPDAVSRPLAEWISANMPVMQSGTAGYPGLGSQDQTVEYTVTFFRPFPVAPRVFMQADNQRVTLAVWDISRTGFKWMARNNSSGNSSAGSALWFALSGTTGR